MNAGPYSTWPNHSTFEIEPNNQMTIDLKGEDTQESKASIEISTEKMKRAISSTSSGRDVQSSSSQSMNFRVRDTDYVHPYLQ